MNETRGLISPNLDALAQKDGVILKNYYVQPICSPTRSAFMTGRYTVRLGTQSNVIFWDTPWGVPANETFLPQNLKDQGYHTAMFGKWHVSAWHKQSTIPANSRSDILASAPARVSMRASWVCSRRRTVSAETRRANDLVSGSSMFLTPTCTLRFSSNQARI